MEGTAAAIVLSEGNGNLFYLRVLPQFQNMGIEKELITRLEQWYKQRGCKSLSLTYESDSPHEVSFSKQIVELGWKEPKLLIHLFIGQADKLEQDEWFHRDFTASNQELFYWGELTEEEKKYLQLQKDIMYSDVYDPFYNNEKISYKYSFGLRENDYVVGWIISEEISQNMIFVRTVYTPEQFGARRASLSLLNRCFGTIYSEKEYPFVMFAVDSSNTTARRIVEKRFKSGIIREKLYFNTQKMID